MKDVNAVLEDLVLDWDAGERGLVCEERDFLSVRRESVRIS